MIDFPLPLAAHLGRDSASAESFLTLLIENMPIMVFVKDARDLRFVRINRAGETLLGLSRGELLGKSDHDLFPAHQADSFIAHDRGVLEGKTLREIDEESIETRTLGTRILRTKKIPIFTAEGEPLYLLGISEDVTEKKQAETERLHLVQEQAEIQVRENEARRMAFLAEGSTILASSLDYRACLGQMARLAVPSLADWALITLREEGRAPAVAAAVHRDPGKEAALRKMAELYFFHQDDPLGMRGDLYSGKSRFAPFLSETLLREGAGTPDRLKVLEEVGCRSLLVVPILSRGKVYGSISLALSDGLRRFRQDDLRVAEELGRRAGNSVDNALLYESARKAAEARDNFLSIASHELKTPIASLKLQIQTTKRHLEGAPEKQPSLARLKEVFIRSEQQVNRIVRLVDDLLDVSRIDAGKLSLHHEPTCVGAMVREILDRGREQAEAAGCEITFREEADVLLTCDSFRVEQVLVNLIGNALKYGRGKPIEILLRREGAAAELIVTDHGMGIRAERVAKIFERFERAESHVGISGLGLGLFIVKSIVEAHGGAISVESRVGEGSSFCVLLPGAEAGGRTAIA